MTEHKMTVKEIAHKHLPNGFRMEVNNKGDFDDYSHTPNWIIDAMKEFALQVATEAVEEAKRSTPGADMVHRHGNRILKNIKKRLNDE